MPAFIFGHVPYSKGRHTVAHVEEAPHLESPKTISRWKKERSDFRRLESIWLPLPSSACVFHLATGILKRCTAQLPEPHTQTHMMSLRFYHYRLQMMLWGAEFFPTLVFANFTLEAITQRGFRLTLKLCKKKEKRNPEGEIQTKCEPQLPDFFFNSSCVTIYFAACVWESHHFSNEFKRQTESNELSPEAPSEQVKLLVTSNFLSPKKVAAVAVS